MKNIESIIPPIFIILLILLIPTFSIAEQRMTTFEMGESGYTISFPMSEKEILAAEKIETAEAAKKKRTPKKQKEKIWVHTYEYGESGLTLNFPMSEKEISEAKAKLLAQAVSDRKSAKKKQEKEFEIVEMGDGYTLKF